MKLWRNGLLQEAQSIRQRDAVLLGGERVQEVETAGMPYPLSLSLVCLLYKERVWTLGDDAGICESAGGRGGVRVLLEKSRADARWSLNRPAWRHHLLAHYSSSVVILRLDRTCVQGSTLPLATCPC